jgi:hypothetical protein
MRDMKIEEKRKMKKLEIGELFKGLGELIKEGQLKMGEKELFFPESAALNRLLWSWNTRKRKAGQSSRSR